MKITSGSPTDMARRWRIAVIAGLVVVVCGVVAMRDRGGMDVRPPGTDTPAMSPAAPALPRLVDLGAEKCVPCRMMVPILAELRTEYAGVLDVAFVDVWKDKTAADTYGIRVIPTQIFYAADGHEIARHEGFLAKEDVLATWREHGIVLQPAAAD